MTQNYILILLDKCISLQTDLMKYEDGVIQDAIRETTGKVYPQNRDCHLRLEQVLYALENRCKITIERVSPFLREELNEN